MPGVDHDDDDYPPRIEAMSFDEWDKLQDNEAVDLAKPIIAAINKLLVGIKKIPATIEVPEIAAATDRTRTQVICAFNKKGWNLNSQSGTNKVSVQRYYPPSGGNPFD